MEDASSQGCSSLPNAARVRDNQRRSRARRKEYVQELEAKVRHYEKHGVQAAKEIQDAARAVLEENRALKAELQELKRLREVDGQSSRSIAMSSGSPAQVEGLANENLALPGILQDVSWARVPENSSTPPNHIISKKRSTSALGIAQTIPRNDITFTFPAKCNIMARPASKQRPMEVPLAACSQNRHSPEPHQQVNASEKVHTWTEELDMSNDRSSCAFAVSVLTSMRADITAEDVQAELGCNSEFDRCSVDNSKLFVAVDRYT